MPDIKRKSIPYNITPQKKSFAASMIFKSFNREKKEGSL